MEPHDKKENHNIVLTIFGCLVLELDTTLLRLYSWCAWRDILRDINKVGHKQDKIFLVTFVGGVPWGD